MRIGELAGLAGISTRAIRHYHRVGLLPELDADLAYAVYARLDELAGAPADDPRVEATAQAIVAAIPAPARQAIRFPDGDREATDGGFAAVPRYPLRRVPRLRRDRPHRRVRQPRVLPHRRRAHRRRMDLLGHRHPAPPAQLTIQRAQAQPGTTRMPYRSPIRCSSTSSEALLIWSK